MRKPLFLLISILIFFNVANAQCPGTVDFSYTQVCNTLTINFTNTSSSPGTITDYDWDFGDASVHGTTANPSHTYPASGSYTVTLIITRSGGCHDTTMQVVDVIPAPVAGFTFAPDNVCSGSTISFSNTSTGTGLTVWTDLSASETLEMKGERRTMNSSGENCCVPLAPATKLKPQTRHINIRIIRSRNFID